MSQSARITAVPRIDVTDRGRRQSRDLTRTLLSLARDHLRMELALVSEFAQGLQHFRLVEGDGETFRIVPGTGISLEEGYCWRMVAGDWPGVIPDVRDHLGARAVLLTRRSAIGAYAGVPLELSDGRVYGTLCCLSHHARPDLEADDLRFLRAVGRLLVEEIERAEATRRRREQVVRIKRLIQQQGLAMVFQPILDLVTERPVGFEALARFSRRAAPARWFAEAAEVGMGPGLELMAVRLAVQAFDLLPAGSYLSINLSPQAVESPGLHEALNGVDGRRVVFELTEHAGVEHYGGLDRALRPFRDRNIRLAIDDVGAGFASLRHVLRLAPDILKLDVSLTSHIDADPVRRALVASLVSFSERVGTTLVAEGIATGRELEVIRELGVGFGQGYFLGRPRPLRPNLAGPVGGIEPALARALLARSRR